MMPFDNTQGRFGDADLPHNGPGASLRRLATKASMPYRSRGSGLALYKDDFGWSILRTQTSQR